MVSSGWSCMRYTANWSAPMSASSRSRSRCAGTGPVRQNLSTMASGTNSVSGFPRSEEHTSELQSPCNLVCRLLPEKIIMKQVDISLLLILSVEFRHISMQNLKCGCCPNTLYMVFPCAIFFNDTATTEIYTLSLHDALPI